ncbi:MAG: helix-turn-helix transcriptional regulator [Prolixibacteraceae bacterium]|jgi:transcriptional regulator with XRE-family HTH domain|nr:helix-turn-helix transcriptional regulator [Prolixibacteraceae bacterium]MBT6004765.1 helix-turn-helix transcriptional regulator [Prolixibacteraceae bacterium]MBT6762962.1 helix-turn-helix transcriptional regulator [Prolixibacteraceae bacterium]MBT7000221.1 helix-turn-helix transcriptional regulator [Prolixibacteraceae bacterium]MBT7393659.1 helix-turn-helix transcriptional regulator [Prolixibacteraceae bacterium]
MTKHIGANIKLFREKSGISQAEIARYCGIQRELLSYYENGQREVSLLHLEKMAEFLNIRLEVFLEEDPKEIKPELELTFRANELTTTDFASIAYFKKIVLNYLKMKKIEANGIQA